MFLPVFGTVQQKGKEYDKTEKDEQTIRSNSIHIRMNDTEYELLQERASAVNMSMAEFIRNALDNQQVTIKYELVADVPEIKKTDRRIWQNW